MKKKIIELIEFIKKPNDLKLQISSNEKLKYIFYFLLFETLITFIIIFPLLELIEKVLLFTNNEGLNYTEEYLFENRNFAFDFWMLVITAPLIEELIFRLPLENNIIFRKLINPKNWNKVFRKLLYISVLSFGFIHSSNFENESFIFYCLIPFITLTQTLGAFVISFLRVRFNFYYGFLYHALYNLILGILLPYCQLIYYYPEYIIDNKNYSLKINTHYYFDEEKQKFKYGIINESFNDSIYRLDIKQYFLQDILNELFNKKFNTTENEIIDLEFYNKDSINIHKLELLRILKERYEIIEVEN